MDDTFQSLVSFALEAMIQLKEDLATCIIALTPLHIFPTASASVRPILSLTNKQNSIRKKKEVIKQAFYGRNTKLCP